MKKLLILSFFLIAMSSIVSKASAISEVKFTGHAISDERTYDLECYGHPFCYVTVEGIIHDPGNTLINVSSVKVCYDESLGIGIGDPVECFGIYYNDVGPFQYVHCVVCVGDPYYVVPEFPSFLLLSLFMIMTLLAVIAYRKRHRYGPIA